MAGNSYSNLDAVIAGRNIIKKLSLLLVAVIAISSLSPLTAMAFGCGGANFIPAAGSPISVPGNNPAQVIVADFNLDGKPDMAVMPTSVNTGSVYLGNGNGSFGAAKPFTAIGNVLAVGDFNSDGKPDLVALSRSNSGSNKITVLLGDGAGNFSAAPGSPFTPASPADFMAAADFNLDGKLDLAYTTAAAQSPVKVLWGNGSGGLSPAPGAPIFAGSFARDIQAVDINSDPSPIWWFRTRGPRTFQFFWAMGRAPLIRRQDLQWGRMPRLLCPTAWPSGTSILMANRTSLWRAMAVFLKPFSWGTVMAGSRSRPALQSLCSIRSLSR
jgi:hypothetical protein